MFTAIKAKVLGILGIAGAVTIVALLVWALRLDSLRAGWRDVAMGITAQIAFSTGQKRLSTSDAVQAVRRLGIERDAERDLREVQTQQIRAWQAENARLAKLSAEWREKARAAIAKRDVAIRRLSAMADDPGDRADCVAQLRAAEEALDYAFEQGI